MMNRKHKSDLVILFATLALMALGLIIIYAIGPMRANVLNNTYGTDYDSNYFFLSNGFQPNILKNMPNRL